MPIYCYICPECGARCEVDRPLEDANRMVCCAECEPGEMHRDFQAERPRSRELRGTASAGWPYESEAAGVGIHESALLAKRLKDAGVPTDVNRETGNPIIRDRSHRNAVNKELGLKDRDGGYGDYTGK